MKEGKFTQEEIDKATKEEVATLPTVGEEVNKGVTVFRRNSTGHLVMPDYMIKGFLKAAASSMSNCLGGLGQD